jgi:hypothetical protein
MGKDMLAMVFLPLIMWLLKALCYWGVFRWRTIPATFLNCLIIAGASFLLSFVPIPLPFFLSIPVVIGLAVYLTMHYTSIPLIPEGLLIPLGIETVFRVAFWLIQKAIIL